ncbi:Uncharacterised protein [Halioglobus japonicus]|nr:Uncharacterised protein [Halioglobus japonicus]
MGCNLEHQPVTCLKERYQTMLIKSCNTVFLLVYLSSAAVQYNDPDALLWVAVYLAAALMCALQFRTNPPSWLPRVLLVISAVWMGALLPSIVGQVSLQEIFASISMKTRAVEEAREIGGLLLVSLWAGVLSYRQRKR